MIGALYKKEILDILRDKKTLLVMILIPLVVYPLIFFGAMSVVHAELLVNASCGRMGDM